MYLIRYSQPKEDPLTAVIRYCNNLSSLIPLTEEGLKELKEKRDYVASVENGRQASGFPAKKATLLFKLQYHVTANELIKNEQDTTEINRCIRYMKELYYMDYPKGGKDFKLEKNLAREQVRQLVHHVYEGYRDDSLEPRFLANPLFADWYKAEMGNKTARRLIDKLQEGKTSPEEIIKQLDDFKPRLDSFCDLLFSDFSCDVDEDKDEETGITEREEIRRWRTEAAVRLKNEKEKIEALRITREEDAKRILLEADSLKIANRPEEALRLYKSMENISFEGNYSKDSILKINVELRRKYVYENYLYTMRGKLRLDTTLKIQPDVLKKFKDNLGPISIHFTEGMNAYIFSECVRPRTSADTDERKRVLFTDGIKDTTQHLYRIVYDSSGILAINHMLLSKNAEYGGLADSILRFGILNIFPYIRIDDDKQHDLFLPVMYIPYHVSGIKCSSSYEAGSIPDCMDELSYLCVQEYPSLSIYQPRVYPEPEGIPLVKKKKKWKLFSTRKKLR